MQTDKYLRKIELTTSAYGYQQQHHDILLVDACFISDTNSAKIYTFIKIL